MKARPLLDYISRHVTLMPEQESILLSRVKFRKYLKGQYVVQHGDICRYESFVLSGCLKTFYIDGNGNEHIVMFAVENWWTGDLGSFITQSEADYSVLCLEDSELVQISYENLQLLYEEIPALDRFFRIIIQNAFVAAQKRIVESFSLSAIEKYRNFRKQYPEIEQRVPQYMVAAYLGITPEFLSKIRRRITEGQ